MSTAPRPHTSPSTSSPPNGSRLQCSGLTGTTSVCPISSRVGAVGSVPSMRATRLVRPGAGLVGLEVEARPLEVAAPAGRRCGPRRPTPTGPVVHAGVADERLEQLRALAFPVDRAVGHRRKRRLGPQPSHGVALPPCSAGFRPTFYALPVRPRPERVASRPWHPRPAVVRCLTEATQPPMIRSHVVVDGSNIATEGRTTPSLRQLDDAVTAFLAEHDVETADRRRRRHLRHRIDPSERAEYEEALLAGELVTPPAGAIGRGDAFILQIAEKVDATVLSNDSFQEFHAKHPWLFDEGRLIGGKPVPGVGWVFLLRTPVRGPVSRRATSRGQGQGPLPSDARPLRPAEAEGAGERPPAPWRPSPRRRGGGDRADRGGDRRRPPDGEGPRRPASLLSRLTIRCPFIEFVGKHPVGSTVEGVVETFSSHGAYVSAGGARCYVPLKLMGDPAPRARPRRAGRRRDAHASPCTRSTRRVAASTSRSSRDGIVRRDNADADARWRRRISVEKSAITTHLIGRRDR